MINFYEHIPNANKAINPNFKKHGIALPFRACIAAPSGSGKTNQLLNLITMMDKTFHRIILCLKSADEPLYQFIIEKLGKKVEVYEDGKIPDLPKPVEDERKDKKKKEEQLQSLIVFDDLMYDKSPLILQYYIRGRKFGFSSIYIAQSFYGIPIDIRKNCQYFFLGRGLLKRDIATILSLFPTKLSKDEFTEIYEEATKEPLDVLLVDIEHRNLRYNITDIIEEL
jgi:hypothetical protein